MSGMNKKKIIKNAVFALIVVALAAALEICAFNFKPVTVSLGWRESGARTYTLADVDETSLVNCSIENGALVASSAGASFAIENFDLDFDAIRAEISSDTVSSVTVVYTVGQDEKRAELVGGASNTYVDDDAVSVRFEFGEKGGDRIAALTLIADGEQFHFSWARFIAMIAVCVVTRALFSLQRPIDYGIDTSSVGKKEGEEADPALPETEKKE